MKRISSTSGGGNKGSENTKFNNALAKDSSEPGESEVLWIQPEAGGYIIFSFMDNELVICFILKVAGLRIFPSDFISVTDQAGA